MANCTEPLDIPGWQFQVWRSLVCASDFLQFTTEKARFFKNDRMRQLDEEIGDLKAKICGLLHFPGASRVIWMTDMEIDVIRSLSETVLKYAHVFVATLNVASELDWSGTSSDKMEWKR